MRVSTDETDPGYKNWKNLVESGKTVHAFLDGQKQPSVITADEELGIIVKCVLDEEGHVQVDPTVGNKIWEEVVTGKVHLEIRSAHKWNGS